MASTRSIVSPGQFALLASTSIPPTPISGVSYRNPAITAPVVQDGWPYAEIVNSADFNEIMYRISSLVAVMDVQGLLGWTNLVNYAVGALVIGSNNVAYKAIQANGPATTVQDPVSAPTYWRPFTELATDTAAGIVELATAAETQAGTDATRAVTPAGLNSRVATDTATGLVELATAAETQTGTDNARAVTPAGLSSRTATETRTGIVRKATVAESQAFTADAFLDGARLASAFDGVNLSFATSDGYQRLPNGLLIQWGVGVLPSANCPIGQAIALGNITYPIAFASGVRTVQVLNYGPVSSGIEHTEVRLICEAATLTTFGLSGFRHAGAFAPGEEIGFFWIAVGK